MLQVLRLRVAPEGGSVVDQEHRRRTEALQEGRGEAHKGPGAVVRRKVKVGGMAEAVKHPRHRLGIRSNRST